MKEGFAPASASVDVTADGQQPVSNEDRSISVVFNGELFDYIERREELIGVDVRPDRANPLHGLIAAPGFVDYGDTPLLLQERAQAGAEDDVIVD